MLETETRITIDTERNDRTNHNNDNLPCCNLQGHGNFRSRDDDLLLHRVHTIRHYSLACICSSFEDMVEADSW